MKTIIAVSALALAACGSSSVEPPSGAAGSSGSGASGATGFGGAAGAAGAVASGGTGAAAAGGAAGAAAAGGTAGAAGEAAAGGQGGMAGAAGSGSAPDPFQPGPVATSPLSATANVPSTGHAVPMDCAVPVEPGPHPIVIIAHGFQIAASQYRGYADRLGSFGYVACTADYPAGFSPNHAESAKDLVGALDWAIGASNAAGNPLTGKVDASLAGVMGHSLGGKLSVLAAKQDARFKAVLGLDPVDSAMFCNPTACPDASNALPLPIPTAFLGETLDSTAGLGGQACAPAADNYQTFYASAATPSYELTFVGANHMSFIDDPATCGIVCSFCKPAQLGQADAIALARGLTVAFFERHLRGRTEYTSYLTTSKPGLLDAKTK